MLVSLSMRRLAVVTVVVFLIVFAFLAGRVRAGADPTQVAAPVASSTPYPRSAPPASPESPAYPDDGSQPAPDADPPVTRAS